MGQETMSEVNKHLAELTKLMYEVGRPCQALLR